MSDKTLSDNSWDPNVPFCGTQEEWWEHFQHIEEGEFYTLEEFDEKFEAWKKNFLASRMIVNESVDMLLSDNSWNPNVPFCGTQEEPW
jgi:hypothetical protein